MDVEPKIGGKPTKMDGENHGSNPMNKWDDLGGVNTPIFEINTHISNFLGPQKQSTKNSLIFGFYSHGSQHVEVTGIRITTQGTFNRSFIKILAEMTISDKIHRYVEYTNCSLKVFEKKKTLKCSQY